MTYFDEEMKSIKVKKKWFYKSPLPMKKQRTTARAERPGKVKVFSSEEIQNYLRRKRNERRSKIAGLAAKEARAS